MAALARGFSEPVHESQSVFRALMDAFARPARELELTVDLAPPAPLTPELAAVALALADPDAALWLDAGLAGSEDVVAFLRFHTGAKIVADPADAAFALVSDPAALPAFASFAQGTDAYPDRSTTLIVAVARIDAAGRRFSGPGILGDIAFTVSPEPRDFVAQWAANRAGFPRGVDLIVVAPGRVAALPRSSALILEG